jgi:hypothetical protein
MMAMPVRVAVVMIMIVVMVVVMIMPSALRGVVMTMVGMSVAVFGMRVHEETADCETAILP